jgi:1-acyl-sn-glycerol-3-phosphate acyltransferase
MIIKNVISKINFFRSILYFLFLNVILTIAFLVFDVIEYILPKSSKISESIQDIRIELFSNILRIINDKYYGFYVYNKDYYDDLISKNQRVIFAPNHHSMLDFLLYIFENPFHPTGVIKKEFMYIPFFGYNSSKCFFMCYRKKSNDIVRVVSDHITKNDFSIGIFPEGTRKYKYGEFFDPKNVIRNGIFYVAKETGYPIIPVYTNLIDIQNDSKIEYYAENKGKVCFLLGKELYYRDYNDIDKMKKSYIDEMMRLHVIMNEHRKKVGIEK